MITPVRATMLLAIAVWFSLARPAPAAPDRYPWIWLPNLEGHWKEFVDFAVQKFGRLAEKVAGMMAPGQKYSIVKKVVPGNLAAPVITARLRLRITRSAYGDRMGVGEMEVFEK